MSRGNKILVGFIIGAIILGTIGLLLAPHLLTLVGIGVASSPVTQMLGASSISTFTSAFSTLTAVSMGLLGGLAGGLIGVTSNKTENYSALGRYAPLSSIAPIANEKATGYAPSLDVDGQETGKSHVKRYEQEKLASLQPPNQWRM